MDERRLVLTVAFDGTVVGTSSSPQALFGFAPANLVGRPVDRVLDVFKQWTAAGEPLDVALNAFMLRAASVAGSSWRVGLMAHHLSMEEEAEEAAGVTHSGPSSLTRPKHPFTGPSPSQPLLWGPEWTDRR